MSKEFIMIIINDKEKKNKKNNSKFKLEKKFFLMLEPF